MASPAPKENNSKEKLLSSFSKLETEMRWCSQHPNDVSDVELEQLKQAIDEIDPKCKDFGGQFYNDFKNFRKKFDIAADNPQDIKTGDFQKFEDMIQKLLKDLQ